MFQSFHFSRWYWITTVTWLIFPKNNKNNQFLGEKKPLAINPRILISRINDNNRFIEEYWKLTDNTNWQKEIWSERGFLPGKRNHFKGLNIRVAAGHVRIYICIVTPERKIFN